MEVISMHCANPEQLGNELRKVIEHEFIPSVALVFTSSHQDITAITSAFSALDIDVIGCTTAGEIVNDQLYENSIAVFLMDIEKSSYNIILEKYAYSSIKETAWKAGQKAKSYFDKPGLLLLSSGLSINAEQLIVGLKEAGGAEMPIYGGLAGDDLEMSKTIVFTNDHIEEQGIAMLVLDTNKITMQGLATSGWESVGVENTVTKAEGNKVYEINGEPAFTVFSRYFGFSDDPASNQDQLITLQINYPFQFIRKEGHTVLRSPLLIDQDESSITLSASVNEGDKFKFSYSPGFEIIEQTIEEFGKLKKETPEADGIILFSCKGRHGAFGPLLEKEVTGIFDYWKKPMIGFLSYGEIGDIGNGICEFHNETCSLVILKEK